MSHDTWCGRIEPSGERVVYLGLRRYPPQKAGYAWPSSPDHWWWGDMSLVSHQLAHSMLYEVTGDDLFAGALYSEFCSQFVSKWDNSREFSISTALIVEWIKKEWHNRHPSDESPMDWLDD